MQYLFKALVVGAPTGSGKTISAELAMMKVFRDQPGCKVVYIAPLKVRPVESGLTARAWADRIA